MTVKGPKARTKHPDRSGWCLEDVQGRQKGAAAQIVLCHNGGCARFSQYMECTGRAAPQSGSVA